MTTPLIIQIKHDITHWQAGIAAAKRGARDLADTQSKEMKRASADLAKQQKINTDLAAQERKRGISEAIKDFDRLTKEDSKQSAQRIKGLQRETNEIVAATKKRTGEIDSEAKKQAASQIAAQKKWERENVVSLGSVQQAGMKFQDKVRSDAEKSAAAQARATKKSLTDEQLAFQVRNNVILKANKARVDSATRAATGEKEAFDMGGIAAGGLMSALSAVVGAGSAIARMWGDIRKEAHEAVTQLGGAREELLEIAALKGHLGDTTEEMRQQVIFRSQTLQTAPAAKAFQQQMMNVGDANVAAGLISREQFNESMVYGGKFQAAEGGDAATHGKLMGIMPALMGKKGITAQEMAASEQKIFNIMQKGGFDFSSGANQLIQQQGLITSGQFKDPMRMAATLSALSLGSSPLEAGTHLEHLVEGTTGAFDRLRQGKIDGETQTQSAYLKSIGAKLGMDPLEMGKLIAQDISSAKQAAGAAWDPTNYLQHKGYQNRQARMAILTLSGQAELGQLGGFEARAGTATGLLPEDTNDPNYVPAEKRLAMFRNSTVAARRQASLAQQVATQSTGGGAMEYYAAWNKTAFEAAKARDPKGWAGGDYESWKDSYVWGGKQGIYQELMDATVEAARRKGINVPGRDIPGGQKGALYDFGEAGKFPVIPDMLESDQSRAQTLTNLAGKLGVNPMEILMERIAKSNEEMSNTMKKVDQKLGATPVPPPQARAGVAPAARRGP